MTKRSSCAATKACNYGTVMEVMSRINQGGFKKLSFVLDGEKGGT